MPSLPYVIGEDVPQQPSSSVATYNPDIVPQALEKGGQELNQAAIIAGRQQKLEAMQDVAARKNVAEKAVLNTLYGDGTPGNTGLYGLQGVNARGMDTTFENAMGKIREQAMTGIKDQFAARAMTNELNSLELTHLSNVKAHMAQQSRAYSGELMGAQSAMQNELVARAPLDDSVWQKSVASKQEAIAEQARMAGAQIPEFDKDGKQIKAGDDVYQQTLMKGMGGLVHDRVETLLNNPDPAVQAKGLAFWRENKIPMDAQNTIATQNLIDKAQPRLDAMASFHDFSMQHSINAGDQTPEDQIRFTLNKLEGPQTVMDSNGYKAQYGFNAKYNGDLAIGNLTEDQAVKAAKERYWDKYNISDLPKAVQGLAFDTYFNGGDGRLLAKLSGGDPVKFLQLREQRYRELAQDPEYAKNLPGWLNRVDKLGARVADGPIDPHDAADFQKGLPAAQQEFFGKLVEQHNAAFAAQIDSQNKATLGQALQMYGKGANWMSLPVTLQQKAIDGGFADELKNYNPAAPSSPPTMGYLTALPPEKLAAVDLDAPGTRLTMSQADYERTKKKQVLLIQSPSAMATFQDMHRMMMDDAKASGMEMKTTFDDQGNPKQEGGIEFQRAAQLVETKIDAFTSTHAGKYPEGAQVRAIIDDVFLNSVKMKEPHTVFGVPFWPTTTKEVKQYDIGKPITQDSNDKTQIIPDETRKKIMAHLIAQKMSPTESNITAAYISSLKAGQ